MKLTYWACKSIDDSDCYSIVAKTKREANEKRDEQGADRYASAVKCVIDYTDAFDLMDMLTSEGGGRTVFRV